MAKGCAHLAEIPSSLCIHRQRIVLGIPCTVISAPLTSDLAPIPGYTEIFCSADDSLESLPYHQDPLFTEVTAIHYTPLSHSELHDFDCVVPSCSASIPLKPILSHGGPDGTTQLLQLPPPPQTSEEGLSTTASSEDTFSDCSRKRFVVSFTFRAKINSLPEGLYRVQERAAWDEEDWTNDVTIDGSKLPLPNPPVLATAFEQLFARRTFPTLDYPFVKIVFQLSVVLRHCSHHGKLKALSTTAPLAKPSPYLMSLIQKLDFPPAASSTSIHDHLKLISFAPTPRIGAYSLSLFLSDFETDSIDTPTSWGRSYALEVAVAKSTIGRLPYAQWTMRMAARLLSVLSTKVFAQDPMRGSNKPKITLVPLKNQRGIGLENHGCISLKEDYFFVDGTSSLCRVLRIARLLVHELAHQWIGNTYTPMPLDQIWMKEGLTRCLEFTTLDYVFRESEAARAALWATYTYDIKFESIWNDVFRGATPFDPPKINRADVLSRNAFWDPGNRDGSPRKSLGQSCCTMYPAPSLGSHPLTDPEHSSVTHEELLLLYDTLAYNKAASLLLMVDGATGTDGVPSLWQTAIAYLTCELDERKTCVFEEKDLFQVAQLAMENRRVLGKLNLDADLHLEALFVDKPIADMQPYELLPPGKVPLDRVLSPWLQLKGFPLIHWTVQRYSADERTVDLLISQIPSEMVKAESNIRAFRDSAWPVPLTIWVKTQEEESQSRRSNTKTNRSGTDSPPTTTARHLQERRAPIQQSRFYLSGQQMLIRVRSSDRIVEVGVDDGSEGYGHFIFAWSTPPRRNPARKGSVVGGISHVLERRISSAIGECAQKRLAEVLSVRAHVYLFGGGDGNGTGAAGTAKTTIDTQLCDLVWNMCSRLCVSAVTFEDLTRVLQGAVSKGSEEHEVVRMIFAHANCINNNKKNCRRICTCGIIKFNQECHQHLMAVVGLHNSSSSSSSLPPDRSMSFPPDHWLDCSAAAAADGDGA